jgi:hypothetical protein
MGNLRLVIERRSEHWKAFRLRCGEVRNPICSGAPEGGSGEIDGLGLIADLDVVLSRL